MDGLPKEFESCNSNSCFKVKQDELTQLSFLKTSPQILAVFHIPEYQSVDSDITVVLDQIRDPGNLGTIIRLCDWFGVKQLICSQDCVDVFNPKVVQSSMASIARVNVTYVELLSFLEKRKSKALIYKTAMDAPSLYKVFTDDKLLVPLKPIYIVMGNEANGVSRAVSDLCNVGISIPQYGEKTTESLNVAMATGIILSEFRRVM